jgi:hypothetical protein
MLSDLKRVPLGRLVEVLLIPPKDDREKGARVATFKLESFPVIQVAGDASDIPVLVGLCVPRVIASVLPRPDMDLFFEILSRDDTESTAAGDMQRVGPSIL